MQGLFIAFWASFRNKGRILRYLETCSNKKRLEPLSSKGKRNGNSVAGTQGCLELWKRGHFHMSCVDTEMKLETCHCLRCGPKAGRKCNSVYIYLNKLLKKSLTFWLERLFWKELAFQKLQLLRNPALMCVCVCVCVCVKSLQPQLKFQATSNIK